MKNITKYSKQIFISIASVITMIVVVVFIVSCGENDTPKETTGTKEVVSNKETTTKETTTKEETTEETEEIETTENTTEVTTTEEVSTTQVPTTVAPQPTTPVPTTTPAPVVRGANGVIKEELLFSWIEHGEIKYCDVPKSMTELKQGSGDNAAAFWCVLASGGGRRNILSNDIIFYETTESYITSIYGTPYARKVYENDEGVEIVYKYGPSNPSEENERIYISFTFFGGGEHMDTLAGIVISNTIYFDWINEE